jgi:hypothetical protein
MPLPVADEALQLKHVQEDLLREFPDLPPEVVVSHVRSRSRVFQNAPVRNYVPVLVGRSARAELRRLG